jgi:hypothetical protein
MTPKIFISYRRDESTGYAGRIHEGLARVYGTDSVFMDMDDIDPGADFVRAIEDQISACDVLLVLIGNQWLTVQNAGKRRIDDPNDFVHVEISRALARDIRIIPVLLNNARMPAERDLPDAIKNLCRHQAIPLSEERWDYDFGKLVEALSARSGIWGSRRKIIALLAGGAAFAVIPAGWWATRSEPPVVSGRWTAEVKYDFGVSRVEVFSFQQTAERIRGTASFLGVDRAIVDGQIEDDMLQFVTRTAEVAGDENRETTHEYNGKIDGDSIEFVMQTIGGFSDHPPVAFTARRAAIIDK